MIMEIGGYSNVYTVLSPSILYSCQLHYLAYATFDEKLSRKVYSYKFTEKAYQLFHNLALSLNLI